MLIAIPPVPNEEQVKPFTLVMFRNTLATMAKRGSEEIERRARRVSLTPQFHAAQNRMQVWQLRFKEVGPAFSKVWLALGGKMRRRRIGRSVSFKDQRYYWRPIEPSYQRLYQSKLRQKDHSNPAVAPQSLRPKNWELGLQTSRIEYERADHRKYFQSGAGPKRLDFEFRAL